MVSCSHAGTLALALLAHGAAAPLPHDGTAPQAGNALDSTEEFAVGDAVNPQGASVVAGLEGELKRLRGELERLRRRGAGRQQARGTHAVQEQILVLTLCAGTAYFDTYCGPLFASFERAYGVSAKEHRVVAFTISVDPRVLDIARERFKPWAVLHPFATEENAYPLHDNGAGVNGSYRLKCNATDTEEEEKSCIITGSMENRNLRTGSNVVEKFRQSALYIAKHGRDFDYAMVMDSDALFVRPVQPALRGKGPAHPEESWDVAYTVYGPDFTTPWAEDAAKVGRTKSGFVRINAGVAFVRLRNHSLAAHFLNRWAHISQLIMTGGYGMSNADVEFWTKQEEELVEEFRGSDPAALVLLLSSFALDNVPALLSWDNCQACSGIVEADVAIFQEEPALPVRFGALPARLLNHAESMANGTFPPDLAVVHLKGPWWRAVLSNGKLYRDATRKPEWNRDALALHRRVFYEWQFALPPEMRAEVPIRPVAMNCTDATK